MQPSAQGLPTITQQARLYALAMWQPAGYHVVWPWPAGAPAPPLADMQTVARQSACCKRMYCADHFRHNKAVRHQGPLFLRLASQRPRTPQSCAHQHALAGVAGQRADGHVGQPRLHAAGVCVRALLNLAPAARRACVAPLAQSGESVESPRTFCSQASPHGCRGVHDGRNAARTGAQGLSRRVAQGLR
jgi:hypothetical protein